MSIKQQYKLTSIVSYVSSTSNDIITWELTFENRCNPRRAKVVISTSSEIEVNGFKLGNLYDLSIGQ
jgi:hypothetical protein